MAISSTRASTAAARSVRASNIVASAVSPIRELIVPGAKRSSTAAVNSIVAIPRSR